MAPLSRQPAAFIDRDGTLIVERYYLADPDGVVLVPGAAAALRRLAAAGYALVLVTNQSGIARGFYSLADFQAVQQRLQEVLATEEITLAGVYYCPHHPEFGPPCDCRKPALGLFQRAAGDLELDLGASVFIGDRLKDVEPARAFGGRGILVRTGYGQEHEAHAPPDVDVVADLAAAVELVLGG